MPPPTAPARCSRPQLLPAPRRRDRADGRARRAARRRRLRSRARRLRTPVTTAVRASCRVLSAPSPWWPAARRRLRLGRAGGGRAARRSRPWRRPRRTDRAPHCRRAPRAGRRPGRPRRASAVGRARRLRAPAAHPAARRALDARSPHARAAVVVEVCASVAPVAALVAVAVPVSQVHAADVDGLVLLHSSLYCRSAPGCTTATCSTPCPQAARTCAGARRRSRRTSLPAARTAAARGPRPLAAGLAVRRPLLALPRARPALHCPSCSGLDGVALVELARGQ